MKISDLRLEDIYRLVECMKQCDSALYDAHQNWEASFSIYGYAPIKAATVFWGRVSNLLELSKYRCTDGMPVITSSTILDDDGNCEDIFEYSMSYFDLANPKEGLLKQAGIDMDTDYVSYDCVTDFITDAQEDAREEGENIDRLTAQERGKELFKECCKMEVTSYFPKFVDDLFDFIADHAFEASEVCFFKSKRVGTFLQKKEAFKAVLPKELYDSLYFLIDAVFMPLYVFFPDLVHDEFTTEGEYCSIYVLGNMMEDSCEEIHDIHKRPYADIAVLTLDRLLQEAEVLAPDIWAVNTGTASNEKIAS